MQRKLLNDIRLENYYYRITILFFYSMSLFVWRSELVLTFKLLFDPFKELSLNDGVVKL